MYIAIDSDTTGEATDPVDVRPCDEAETDGSYGYESHTHELNMALGEPPEGRYRHPLDWPSRKHGMQQIVYATHPSYAARKPDVLQCIATTLWCLEEPPCWPPCCGLDTMPAWRLGSSI